MPGPRLPEFEEKEYEQPLNKELLFDAKNHLWPPGQVFEEHFGVDAVLFAENPRFWNLFGYPDIPVGLTLEHFNWGYLWRKVGSKRQFPTFKTNLLLQTKRPIVRKGNIVSRLQYKISGKYWKFEVMEHQQQALHNLYRKLSKRILICYAAPAFDTLNELFSHINSNELVEKSSFVQTHRMTGHKVWVYNQSGTKGLACSKIEKITDDPFQSLLERQRELVLEQDKPLNNLLELEEAVLSAIKSLSDSSPISQEFNRRLNKFSSYLRSLARSEENDAIRAYYTFLTFCILTNVNWFVNT